MLAGQAPWICSVFMPSPVLVKADPANANGVLPCATPTDIPIGVAQGLAGGPAQGYVNGEICNLTVSSTSTGVNPGDTLISDSSGTGQVLTFTSNSGSTAQYAGAIALGKGTANGLVRVLVTSPIPEVATASQVPSGVTFPSVTGTAQVNTGGSTQTTTYTIQQADELLLGDATSAGFTYTMPAANATPKGKKFTVLKKDTTAHLVTVLPAGADLISGQTGWSLGTQGNFMTMQCDGVANWWIVAKG